MLTLLPQVVSYCRKYCAWRRVIQEFADTPANARDSAQVGPAWPTEFLAQCTVIPQALSVNCLRLRAFQAARPQAAPASPKGLRYHAEPVGEHGKSPPPPGREHGLPARLPIRYHG